MIKTIIFLLAVIKPVKTLHFRVVGWGERPIAFCKRGKIAVTLPSRIRIVNPETWFTEFQVETEDAITISSSPDGNRLVVGCDRTDKNLFILDLNTQERKYLTGHSQAVHSVSWSPDGRWLASGGLDSNVVIWDTKNLRPVKKFHNESFVYVVSWASNGRWLAYGTASGRIVVVEAGSWKTVMDVDPNHGAIYSIDWSHDGKKMAVATGWPDNTLLVFSTRWKLRLEATPHLSTIWSVAWSPDDRYIATVSGDSSLKIISYPDGEVVDEFRSGNSWFESVAWSNEFLVATQWDGTVIAFKWHPSPGVMVAQRRNKKPNRGGPETPEIVLFSPDVDDNGRGIVRLTAREGELIPIKGVVVSKYGVSSVFVNSVEADVTRINPVGAKFQAYVPVSSGVNKIAVVAVDKKGHKTRQNFTIIGKEDMIANGSIGQIWAVVVGVDTYADPGINLKYASADARSFSSLLVGPNVGASGSHVKTLLNEKATRANILKNLMEVARKANENDLIIVYMAMHGLPELGKLYFLPHDGDPSNIVGTGISRDDIIDIFEWPDKKLRVLFIFDVCHAAAFDMLATYMSSSNVRGRALLARTANDLLYRIANSRRGISVLASTSVYDLSYEDNKLRHGIFTYYLIEALKGKADENHDGIVTLGEAADYVRKKVIAATDGRQIPQLRGDRNLPLSRAY